MESENYLNHSLKVACVAPGIYKSNKLHPHNNRRFVFGGHLLAQASNAACNTIPPDVYINILHIHFISPGSWEPITYYVTKVRDGKTFCNRTVQCVQNDKQLTNMQILLKRNELNAYIYKKNMPQCPSPEEVIPIDDIFESQMREMKDEDLKSLFKSFLPIDPVIQFRPVRPETMVNIQTLPPQRLMWLKLKEMIQSTDQNWHRCILAYLSDYILPPTVISPKTDISEMFHMLTLDHSIWYHKDVDVNEWLLYETETSHAGNSQGLILGRFWNQDGELLATVSQTGSFRKMNLTASL